MAIKLFLGCPGAGKSLAIQDLVYESTKQGWPCFVIDHCLEWLTHSLNEQTGELDKPNIRWRGKPPLIIRVPIDSPDEATEEGLEKNACLVHESIDGWTPELVAKQALRFGNCIYVDDEIDMFAVYKGWEENPLKEFIHRGRHMMNERNDITKMHVFGAARRPQNLHTDLTSMADEVFTFRVQGKTTLKRVVDEGYILPEQVEIARNMDNLDYFKWTSGGRIIQGYMKCIHGKTPACITCKTAEAS